MSNRIAHLELATTDTAASAKFYVDLLGWPMETTQPMDYTMTMFPPGETTMGLSPVNEEFGVTPGSVLVYVDVTDIDAFIARAKELGAPIYVDKMEIEGIGWMAVVGDPGGNRMGAMQRMEPPSE
ncbi:VOC family protein [Chloroflexota bacterium]